MDFSDVPDLMDVHKAFLENPFTIKNARRNFHEWHQGRTRFAFWAIDVDYPAVRQQMQIAQQHLGDLLLEGYCRQPHITLGISGFLSYNQPFSAEHKGGDYRADDYCFDAFAADILALGSAGIAPFEIEIGALASFSSAPFLHVQDSANKLGKLHEILHSHTHDEVAPYVPHVTVGLYADAWQTEMVNQRMAMVPQHEGMRCLIRQISLMSYCAAEIGGKLLTVADYDLEKSVLEWRQPSLFRQRSLA